MATPDVSVAELLAGPRGRRACFEWVQRSVQQLAGPDHRFLWSWLLFGGSGDLGAELTAAVAGADLVALAGTEDPQDLLPMLAESVNWARYWQGSDEVDTALLDPGLALLLEPVAAALFSAPAARWWADPVALTDQRHIRWDTGTATELSNAPAVELLRSWHAAAAAEEEKARRERPVDPEAPHGGHWWSTPAMSGLVATTTVVPGSDLPVGLVLLEDAFGAERAEICPVRISRDARVYEVTGAAAWAELTARYPLAVTSSRRHDWFRTTGWRGQWLMPDWQAVANDWDGVHLTVYGYLSTAGRLLTVPGDDRLDVRTLLAGWDAGATWWLADVTTPGAPTPWRTEQQRALGWTPSL